MFPIPQNQMFEAIYFNNNQNFINALRPKIQEDYNNFVETFIDSDINMDVLRFKNLYYVRTHILAEAQAKQAPVEVILNEYFNKIQ